MDAARLQNSFERIKDSGDNFAAWFYADLFAAHPELREMFPLTMTDLRKHFRTTLAHVVAGAGDPDRLVVGLRRLGDKHRSFGVLTDGGHYEAVAASLLAALRHFSAEEWTPELEQDWTDAYNLVAGVMRAAARQKDEQHAPAQWTGTVTHRAEGDAVDVSILQVMPEPLIDYLPGQMVPVQIPSSPVGWQRYAPACPLRPDGLLEFHVRAAGPVGLPLATAEKGMRLRLLPADGQMTLRSPARPVLMAAGSTGLAPMLALIGQIALLPAPPPVRLFWGARDAQGLYLWDAVKDLAAGWPWLEVTPVVAAGRGWRPGLAPGILRTGHLPGIVAAAGSWSGHDAYVAGPSKMVSEVTSRLEQAGMPASQISGEDLGWDEP